MTLLVAAALVAAAVSAVAATAAGWGRKWGSGTLVMIAVTAAVSGASGAAVIYTAGHDAPTSALQSAYWVLTLSAAAASIDLQTRIIPNPICAATAAVAIAGWAASGFNAYAAGIAVAAALFMLGAFLAGGCGAGDVKLLPSVVLAVTALRHEPYEVLLTAQAFFAVMAVAFIVQWAGTRLVTRGMVSPAGSGAPVPAGAEQGESEAVPLGPAIFIAALVAVSLA